MAPQKKPDEPDAPAVEEAPEPPHDDPDAGTHSEEAKADEVDDRPEWNIETHGNPPPGQADLYRVTGQRVGQR